MSAQMNSDTEGSRPAWAAVEGDPCRDGTGKTACRRRIARWGARADTAARQGVLRQVALVVARPGTAAHGRSRRIAAGFEVIGRAVQAVARGARAGEIAAICTAPGDRRPRARGDGVSRRTAAGGDSEAEHSGVAEHRPRVAPSRGIWPRFVFRPRRTACHDYERCLSGAIVAAKRDRFARDVAIAGSIDRIAAKAGARVLSADGGNGDDDGDALKRDLDAVLSAHERRVIRRRTRDALAVKKARGERTGATPFGMRSTSPDHCAACAAHAAEKRRPHGLHLEPDPAEQRTIARAKELSDAGLTVRRIAEELAHEGFRNRAGRALAFQAIGLFLRPLLAAE